MLCSVKYTGLPRNRTSNRIERPNCVTARYPKSGNTLHTSITEERDKKIEILFVNLLKEHFKERRVSGK